LGPPAVGICAAIDRVVRGPWDEVVVFTQRTYVDAVQRAGALALVLPPDEAAGADPDPWLDRLDGLILAGGADVDPASYGAEAASETTGTWPERDRFELGLARGALERRMPVLGICRGMETLNVTRGGTLVQHLPDVVGHDRHRAQLGSFGEHEVRLEPGSVAARAAGADHLTVKSHHHQGIDRLGDGLVATGWSVPDDVVEAIELPESEAYVLGVLWHPEEDGESRVIESLVEAARAGVAA
jgi:putative glutamine amidotransferase